MAEDIQKLLNQAQAAGWVFQGVEDDPNTGTPKIKGYWNTKPDPNIMARLKANKPAIVAQLRPTPTKDRARDAKTASLPWLGRLNKTINEKIEPDPNKHPYLHALYPKSAAGKAIEAVPTLAGLVGAAPETILGGAALGGMAALGAGTAAGEVKTGSDVLGTTAMGALSVGGPMALGKIPGAINILRHKADIVADLDAGAQNEYVSKALGLKRVNDLVKRGRTWVSALRDSFTQKEAWSRMSGELDGVGQDLQTKVQDQIDQLKQAFQQKYGVGKNMMALKGQLKANKQMLQDFQALKDQVNTLRSIPNKYRQSLSALKKLGKGAYDKSGAFRGSKGAIGDVESYGDIQAGLKNILSGNTKDLPFNDPSLLQRYEEATKGYQQFAGFRDLAKNPKILTSDITGKGGMSPGKINTAVLQKISRDYPAQYQNKLGDLWDGFINVIKRGEVDSEGVDVQGNVPSLRNTSGHVRSGGITGFVRNTIPYRGQYLGKTPSLLSHDAISRAIMQAPPALVIGGATAGANIGEGIGLLGPDEIKEEK